MTSAALEAASALVGGKEIAAPEDARRAIELAAPVCAQARRAARLPVHQRHRVLLRVAELLERESGAFASLICEEVRKPVREARREAERAALAFRWAAEEARRFGGEWTPPDLDPATEGRLAVVRRFPRGPCLFITPFNFPLHLVAHKAAPAIAVGAPFVLKPAPQAPRTALKLGRLLLEAGWPEELFAVLPCPDEAAEALARDERFAVLSFTGSAAVGRRLRSLAGAKHCVLELGGGSAVVVAADADLPWAAARVAWSVCHYAGQACVSARRIFVQSPAYEEFTNLLLRNLAELKLGDPADPATDVGPLIDSRAAARAESWVQEAVAGGGKLLCGGGRRGELVEPTLVEAPPVSCRLSREEAFGPVAAVWRTDSLEEALRRAGDGPCGPQAGLFTRDLRWILEAWQSLRVGGLIVNDVPSLGEGREGPRWAMEELTEPRTLVLRP